MQYVVVTVVAFSVYHYKYCWLPYYNYYFTNYHDSHPKEGEGFIVGTEPHNMPLPGFPIRVLRLSFPDRKIVIDNNLKPHLILKSEALKTKESLLVSFQQANIMMLFIYTRLLEGCKQTRCTPRIGKPLVAVNINLIYLYTLIRRLPFRSYTHYLSSLRSFISIFP